MVMVETVLPVDDALDGAKVFHVAWNGDGAFLLEPVFLFSFFQQLHEQWMVHVHNRDHKPLLLFPLPHQDRQTPFWDVLQVLLLLVLVVVKVEMRNVQVKAHVVMMVMVFWIVMMIAEDPHIQKDQKNGIKSDEGYKKTSEKGQGSEEDMARLKRVREESVRDLGMFAIVTVARVEE
ncbi:unnamed protein product [Sphenostylis stenocarpa]|uniref:Uncharacterized protein n=1 Tax=Sphenostylis stenocarpa TaxID=92480 RepID=A0AA86VVN6_9FABA|nr:unnamed protein product [Sphenostylis stenocarpa]